MDNPYLNIHKTDDSMWSSIHYEGSPRELLKERFGVPSWLSASLLILTGVALIFLIVYSMIYIF